MGSKESKQQKIKPKEVDIVYIGNKLKEKFPNILNFMDIFIQILRTCIVNTDKKIQLYTNIERLLIEFFSKKFNSNSKKHI